jgi:hypothetical protein
MKQVQIPREVRRGWLKNGNIPGNYSTAPRCGAKTRRGTTCQCPAMTNGRCKLHGGMSTGPKTAEGIERIWQARLKHGRFTKEARAERRYIRELILASRASLRVLDGSPIPTI